MEKLVKSECSKNAELGEADVDVNVDADLEYSEDFTYPDSECEYYTAFYLCTISEHIFQNVFYYDYVLIDI